MSDLTKKILSSGLVDEYTATLMEKWGYLPEGAAAIAKDKENVLKNATKEQLTRLAEDIGDEIERKVRLKESMFDLHKLRWPVHVNVWHIGTGGVREKVRFDVAGVIDRMGRYYFRPADVQLGWFTPGNVLCRIDSGTTEEVILESSELYVEDQIMAIQVSTRQGG